MSSLAERLLWPQAQISIDSGVTCEIDIEVIVGELFGRPVMGDNLSRYFDWTT